MVKYICDVCKKECSPIFVNLPTLNRDGKTEHNFRKIINHRSFVGVRKFELCDYCYGNIATTVFGKTNIMADDE